MQLIELLSDVRKLYVESLLQRIDSQPTSLRKALCIEALYLDESSEPLLTGSLSLPARGDLCVQESGKVRQVAAIESARTLRFAPFRFAWRDTLDVALHPFGWDRCELSLPASTLADLEELRGWLNTEIDPTRKFAQGQELLEVVHSLSAPRDLAEGTRLEIDLGSAQVGAFERLLDACARAGFGWVVIGVPDSS